MYRLITTETKSMYIFLTLSIAYVCYLHLHQRLDKNRHKYSTATNEQPFQYAEYIGMVFIKYIQNKKVTFINTHLLTVSTAVPFYNRPSCNNQPSVQTHRETDNHNN